MSSLADRSFTTRYAQKRAHVLAVQYALNTNQENRKGQGQQIDDSVRANRSLGQRRLWKETNPTSCTGTLPNGLIVPIQNPPSATIPGTCCTPV